MGFTGSFAPVTTLFAVQSHLDRSSIHLFAQTHPEVRALAVVSTGREGLPLVAHNSPFDEGCLRAVFELYGMPYPGYRFYCTCRASRRTFGSSLPNHQLHTVSAACGFDLANHHHALADAEACARIALKIL